jgi:hypothetical protein
MSGPEVVRPAVYLTQKLVILVSDFSLATTSFLNDCAPAEALKAPDALPLTPHPEASADTDVDWEQDDDASLSYSLMLVDSDAVVALLQLIFGIAQPFLGCKSRTSRERQSPLGGGPS